MCADRGDLFGWVCERVCADRGDLFGWGNTEYNQLSAGHQADDMQVNVPQHIPLSNIGKAVKVAAAGSSCALINGTHSDISLNGSLSVGSHAAKL